MATIQDVANAAHVSIATVSRVLNNNRPVHPTIRRAVEDAARRLNYRPNAAARGLRKARSRTLGVIVPDLSNEPHARRIIGIEGLVGEHGFGLFVCDARNTADLFLKHLDLLQQHRVEGLILTPPPSRRIGKLLAQVEAEGTNIVITARRRPIGDHPEVFVDEYGASLDAFRSLLDLGHRRIALISQSYSQASRAQWSTSTESRIDAYIQAHEEAGVAVDERRFIKALSGDEVRERTARLLAEPERPTAIAVSLHSHTPDVLLAIRRSGLRIPDDISLITYGDSRWIEAHDPPISAVCSDDIAYGRCAAELLLSLIAGTASERSLVFPASFVSRSSCAPPPDA